MAKPTRNRGDRLDAAHQEGDGDAHQKGARNPLGHDKGSLAAAVEVAGKAEQEGNQQGIDSVGAQIVCGSCNHLRISGKQAGEKVSVEKGEESHCNADEQGGEHAADHGAHGSVVAVRTDVLGHESGKGLHERGGHQHDEHAELFPLRPPRRRG